jgi:hypothetical protein
VRRLGATALLLVACYDPSLPPAGGSTDAVDRDAVQGPEDSEPPACPATSAGCEGFTCAAFASCFQVCPPHMDFVQANAACDAWGDTAGEVATLAVIGSLAENDCVFERLKNPSSTYWWHGFWIGLAQVPGTLAADQGWSWVHVSGDGFRNWYTGDFNLHTDDDEPNDPGDGEEDCVFMFPYEGMNGGWADARCQQDPKLTMTGYVCELHR